MSELRPEHGTLQAYITGFILSLVFTFIPYYLVVNQVATGTKLFAIILGFGVLQMLVQLLFFLHLGRKPRPHWQIVFLGCTVFAILIVVGGSIIITSNLHNNMMPTQQVIKLVNDEGIYQVNGHKTGACEGQNPNHQVLLGGGTVSPVNTTAKHCDTLTFRNQSSHTVKIVFVSNANPSPYAGVDQYDILAGQNETITLSETGTYGFHDAANTAAAGSFSVNR